MTTEEEQACIGKEAYALLAPKWFDRPTSPAPILAVGVVVGFTPQHVVLRSENPATETYAYRWMCALADDILVPEGAAFTRGRLNFVIEHWLGEPPAKEERK